MNNKGKIISADEAVKLIKNGATVATGGFVGIGVPEEVIASVGKNFLANGSPNGLTLIYAAGQGDSKERGLNHFGHKGLVKRVIGGHWGLVPKLQKLAVENKIDAYNLPQGVISHMYRDIAAGRPRTLSTVGLGTFVDPRNGGGKVNEKTTEEIVELVEFDGKEYLGFKNRPVDVAIIRGSTADEDGNLTIEREALILESLEIAMAARNSGGIVIAQVEKVVKKGNLNSKDVKVPGIMVNYIVLAAPENHWQTFGERFNPAYSEGTKIPAENVAPMKMSERKIIARRAAFELEKGAIVNLGIGMPEGIASVVNEEGITEYITLTAEPGVIGGIPAGGLSFGAAVNTDAVISQPSQFDFYHGGGLDMAFLGLAQADRLGNLNVSKFGPRLAGAGGFIDISQNAKKIIFTGTFTAGGLKVSVKDGKVVIDREGRLKKFVKSVEQVTFSGPYALKAGQPVLYITERCVLKLTPEGMELIEVAPGIDIDRDIISQMEFTPIIKGTPAIMDTNIFKPGISGLKAHMQCNSPSDTE